MYKPNWPEVVPESAESIAAREARRHRERWAVLNPTRRPASYADALQSTTNTDRQEAAAGASASTTASQPQPRKTVKFNVPNNWDDNDNEDSSTAMEGQIPDGEIASSSIATQQQVDSEVGIAEVDKKAPTTGISSELPSSSNPELDGTDNLREVPDMDNNKREAEMSQNDSEGFRSQLSQQEAKDYQLDPSMAVSENHSVSAPQSQQFTTHPVSGEPRYGPLGPPVRHPPRQHANGMPYQSPPGRRISDATRRAMRQPVGRVTVTQPFAAPADRIAGSRRRRRSGSQSNIASDDPWWEQRKRRRIVYCPSIPPNSPGRRRYLTGESNADTVLLDNLPLITLNDLTDRLEKWNDLKDHAMLPPVDDIRAVLTAVERRSDWHSRRLYDPHLDPVDEIYNLATSAMYFMLTNGEWPAEDLADMLHEIRKRLYIQHLRITGFEKLDYIGTVGAWRSAENAVGNQYTSNPLRAKVDWQYRPGSSILDRLGFIDLDDERDVLVNNLNRVSKIWGYQNLKDFLKVHSSDFDAQSETIGNDRTPTPSLYAHTQAPAPQAPKTQASKSQSDSGREDLTRFVDRSKYSTSLYQQDRKARYDAAKEDEDPSNDAVNQEGEAPSPRPRDPHVDDSKLPDERGGLMFQELKQRFHQTGPVSEYQRDQEMTHVLAAAGKPLPSQSASDQEIAQTLQHGKVSRINTELAGLYKFNQDKVASSSQHVHPAARMASPYMAEEVPMSHPELADSLPDVMLPGGGHGMPSLAVGHELALRQSSMLHDEDSRGGQNVPESPRMMAHAHPQNAPGSGRVRSYTRLLGVLNSGVQRKISEEASAQNQMAQGGVPLAPEPPRKTPLIPPGFENVIYPDLHRMDGPPLPPDVDWNNSRQFWQNDNFAPQAGQGVAASPILAPEVGQPVGQFPQAQQLVPVNRQFFPQHGEVHRQFFPQNGPVTRQFFPQVPPMNQGFFPNYGPVTRQFHPQSAPLHGGFFPQNGGPVHHEIIPQTAPLHGGFFPHVGGPVSQDMIPQTAPLHGGFYIYPQIGAPVNQNIIPQTAPLHGGFFPPIGGPVNRGFVVQGGPPVHRESFGQGSPAQRAYSFSGPPGQRPTVLDIAHAIREDQTLRVPRVRPSVHETPVGENLPPAPVQAGPSTSSTTNVEDPSKNPLRSSSGSLLKATAPVFNPIVSTPVASAPSSAPSTSQKRKSSTIFMSDDAAAAGSSKALPLPDTPVGAKQQSFSRTFDTRRSSSLSATAAEFRPQQQPREKRWFGKDVSSEELPPIKSPLITNDQTSDAVVPAKSPLVNDDLPSDVPANLPVPKTSVAPVPAASTSLNVPIATAFQDIARELSLTRVSPKPAEPSNVQANSTVVSRLLEGDGAELPSSMAAPPAKADVPEAANTSVTETSVAETPVAETPAAEIPAVETTLVSTPVVNTSVAADQLEQEPENSYIVKRLLKELEKLLKNQPPKAVMVSGSVVKVVDFPELQASSSTSRKAGYGHKFARGHGNVVLASDTAQQFSYVDKSQKSQKKATPPKEDSGKGKEPQRDEGAKGQKPGDGKPATEASANRLGPLSIGPTEPGSSTRSHILNPTFRMPQPEVPSMPSIPKIVEPVARKAGKRVRPGKPERAVSALLPPRQSLAPEGPRSVSSGLLPPPVDDGVPTFKAIITAPTSPPAEPYSFTFDPKFLKPDMEMPLPDDKSPFYNQCMKGRGKKATKRWLQKQEKLQREAKAQASRSEVNLAKHGMGKQVLRNIGIEEDSEEDYTTDLIPNVEKNENFKQSHIVDRSKLLESDFITARGQIKQIESRFAERIYRRKQSHMPSRGEEPSEDAAGTAKAESEVKKLMAKKSSFIHVADKKGAIEPDTEPATKPAAEPVDVMQRYFEEYAFVDEEDMLAEENHAAAEAAWQAGKQLEEQSDDVSKPVEAKPTKLVLANMGANFDGWKLTAKVPELELEDDYPGYQHALLESTADAGFEVATSPDRRRGRNRTTSTALSFTRGLSPTKSIKGKEPALGERRFSSVDEEFPTLSKPAAVASASPSSWASMAASGAASGGSIDLRSGLMPFPAPQGPKSPAPSAPAASWAELAASGAESGKAIDLRSSLKPFPPPPGGSLGYKLRGHISGAIKRAMAPDAWDYPPVPIVEETDSDGRKDCFVVIMDAPARLKMEHMTASVRAQGCGPLWAIYMEHNVLDNNKPWCILQFRYGYMGERYHKAILKFLDYDDSKDKVTWPFTREETKRIEIKFIKTRAENFDFHMDRTRRLTLVNDSMLHKVLMEPHLARICVDAGVPQHRIERIVVYNFGNATIALGTIEEACKVAKYLRDKYGPSMFVHCTHDLASGLISVKRDKAYLDEVRRVLGHGGLGQWE